MSYTKYGCAEGILLSWSKDRVEADVDDDLVEVGWSAEVDIGFFWKLWVMGSEKRNDWVGMWIGHVLYQIWLHGRDPFKLVKGQGRSGCW